MTIEMKAIGRRRWAIAEGYIPGWSHGPPPDFISHEAVCILNTGSKPTDVNLWAIFSDREPIGPFRFEIGARRTLHLRTNDLTDPQSLPKETDYSMLIEASEPVVVQHTRLDSRQAENALMTTIAYSES